MQGLIFTPRGQLVHEFDDIQPGPIQWAATTGAATVLMPRVSDPFFEAVSRLPRHLVAFIFPDTDAGGGGAGLDPWAGLILEPGTEGEVLMLPLEGAPWMLKRLVMRNGNTTAKDPRVRLTGIPRARLQAALRACPTDGFPFRVSRRSERGDLDITERVMPQSMWNYVQALAKQCGMEWTVEPALEGGQLWLEIVLRKRLGTDYGTADDFELGTEVLRSPQATLNAYGVINEVVAIGKSQQGKSTPCVVVESPRALKAHGVRLSIPKEFPSIASAERLDTAARAYLARRTRPYLAEAKKITNARKGADTFRKVRLGNVFGRRRIEAYSYEPRTNDVTLVLRVVGTGLEPEGDE